MAVLVCSMVLLFFASMLLNRHWSIERAEHVFIPQQNVFWQSGFEHALAQCLWMGLLSYVGEHLHDVDDPYLLAYLQAIQGLKPRDPAVYYMAATALPWMRADAANSQKLLRSALVYLPEDGRWAYYLGVNAWLFQHNAKLADHYLQLALQRGYRQPQVYRLAARLHAQHHGLAEAETWLKQMIVHAPSKDMQAFFKDELRKLRTEVVLRQLERLLPRLPKDVRAHMKQWRAHGLSWPSPLPDGGFLMFDEAGHLRSTKQSKRYRLFTPKLSHAATKDTR